MTTRMAKRFIDTAAPRLATAHLRFGLSRDVDGLEVFSEFTGFGGDLQGILAVPGTRGSFAANHDPYVIKVSRHNYPMLEHFEGDVLRHDVTKFKPCALFGASPACPTWTDAAGRKRDFDTSNQEFIPGLENHPSEAVRRSRLLMDEVLRYLQAMWISGQPVLAGCVENVVQCRKWDQWRRWRRDFHALGYKTRLIALNSMHAEPVRTLRAPQSRDRLYLAYWLEAIGRDPDWDKWLRPSAWCPRCEKVVRAIQVFKNPGTDMGRYKAQYVYRCPSVSCRNTVVEPETLGAHAAIDWSMNAAKIGEREKPLAAQTMARIGVGVLKYAEPFLAPAGGTWRQNPTALSEPMPARTTRENDGVALPPVVITMRGGGSVKAPRTDGDPLTTVTASGNHLGLATGEPVTDMLVPYYSNGTATLASAPLGALSTRDRYAHARVPELDLDTVERGVAEIDRIESMIKKLPKRPKGAPKTPERLELEAKADKAASRMGLEHVRFRMLEPHEIRRAMSFGDDYQVPFGTKEQVVRGFGNAVTAPCAEVIFSALVEAVTGEELERSL